MNKLLTYPLLIIFVMAGFNQLLVYSYVDMSYDDTLEGISAKANQTLNEAESEFIQETSDTVFDINMITGIVALIIGLVAVGVVCGIKILGSGIDTFSVKLIYKSTTYYGLWGIFSALSFTVFSSIPFFGLFIWLGLTLCYSLGFFQTLEG